MEFPPPRYLYFSNDKEYYISYPSFHNHLPHVGDFNHFLWGMTWKSFRISYEAAIDCSAGLESYQKAQLGRDPLLSSHNSGFSEFLDWELQFLPALEATFSSLLLGPPQLFNVFHQSQQEIHSTKKTSQHLCHIWLVGNTPLVVLPTLRERDYMGH